MTVENNRQSDELVIALEDRYRQGTQFIALQPEDQQAYHQAEVDAGLLRQVGELAVRLMVVPPGADVYAVMAEGLRDITGALAVGVSIYDADGRELVIEHIAADAATLTTVDHMLGRSLVGMRMPIDLESRRQLLADAIMVADMSDTVFGVIPSATSARIQETLHIEHLVGLTLRYGQELMGRTVLVIPEGQPPLSTEVLQILAYIAAAALHHKQMAEAMQQRNRELALLNRAGQTLNTSLDLMEVLDTALAQVCSLLAVDACSVWLADSETDELVCRSATGPHREIVLGWRIRPGEGLAGWVFQTGQSLIVPDTQADERHSRAIDHRIDTILLSALSVPLRIKEEIIGVLQVLHAEKDHFGRTDQVLVESLATPVAIALENARLYESLQARMRELREAQVKLIQTAKMAAVGELAAGVAHQINTPLTSVLGFSELLLERAAEDDPSREQLAAIVRQAGRARDTVRSLLDFSRQTESHPKPADINSIVQEALALVRHRLEIQSIELQESYAGNLPRLVVDRPRLKQALLNVITNALYAMPHTGVLSIRTEQVEDEVAVRVSDTGPGIQEKDLDRIFEPFFTTKPDGEGMGLGLSVGLGIVQDHGGRIQVKTHKKKGSTFTVWLPVD
ncbi:MAG: ATP-binding protein [Anaerolineae bacterium]